MDQYTKIKTEIKKSKNILLTLHNHPDSDSLGSNLALFQYLKKINKNVTLISGDSEIKSKNSFFPFFDQITPKNISQININDFDLFIICDALYEQVSFSYDVESIAKKIKKIVFDHHPRQTIKSIARLYSLKATSTSELVYDYLTAIKFPIDSDIAICLMLGIYEDTSGFENLNSTPKGAMAFANLVKKVPNFGRLIFEFKNNSDPQEIEFIKLALSKYSTYLNNTIAISTISYQELQDSKIEPEYIQKTFMSQFLRRCNHWKITGSIVEKEKGVSGVSLRSRGQEFDLSLVADKLGGGGHKVAAGATILLDSESALKLVLKTIEENLPNIYD